MRRNVIYFKKKDTDSDAISEQYIINNPTIDVMLLVRKGMLM